MSKVKFGEFLTIDKEIYKVCPICRSDIKPEWKHVYEHEWCPYCGLNHEEVFKEMLEANNE